MQHQSQSLATSGMQMLPQEVAENIFNALDGDAATLSSCLHVSRVWAALSYPVRFRRVAFSALAAVAEKNLGPRTFDDFLVLLRQSPRLCQCIRELTFRSQSEAGIFDTAVLQSIISRLPFLTTLDIAATSLWPTQTIPHDLAQPVRLRKLTISEDCLWMSQESLASLLNLFDEIDEITHFVSSMPMEHKPGFTVMRPSSNKLEVKSLTFVHGHRPLITKAVESCLTVYSQLLNKNTLTNFSIDPGHLSPDELRAYGRFIAEFGRNVTDFHYGVYRRGNAVDGADIISNFPADAQPGVLTAQYSRRSRTCSRSFVCSHDASDVGDHGTVLPIIHRIVHITRGGSFQAARHARLAVHPKRNRRPPVSRDSASRAPGSGLLGD
ncbi:hypothetical protein BDY19DRAFT_332285 [Irpex rosettiformis]|uniref:Uncharacterized protein n=1 Tax=Irpex rosettiformis TaxID=378272 RepID=A0ACB8TXQ5_9APHY|nr:hypothetical protein BDY19DRAFT_332285 [Irpex rosettiformis]